jgi:hypothetical protein
MHCIEEDIHHSGRPIIGTGSDTRDVCQMWRINFA